MSMATEDQKTQTVGRISIDKAQSLKGWEKYMKDADTFAKAKDQAALSKSAMRETIKKTLNLEGDVDFTVSSQGVTVVRNLQPKTGRRRVKELTF
jgi:hypothetical protein